MKYLVVKRESESLDDAIRSLKIAINILICDGWKPQGGILIAIEPKNEYNKITKYYVAQAMIENL